ncbi:polysaccharide pyruvyl transferase CsaB [bacterium]|nr:polysaccharide pyruvyl transferase CsaB [bacterium]
MKKVLISGYYGYDNFGDEAILSVLVDFMKRRNLDTTVLSHNPLKTSRSYGVKAVKNFNLLQVFVAVLNCNVLLSGGGSLLQDVTSVKSLWYYCFIIWLALKLKKDVIIFAQGIGPLLEERSRKMVFGLLSKCKMVTVRDLKSQEYLAKNGVKSYVVSDPVFSVDLPLNEPEGTVGVQLRSFKTVDELFLFCLAQQVVENFSDRKIELYVFQESLDYPVCKRFETMLKSLAPDIKTEIIHNVSQNDIIIKISKLEYMIAMRFHAVLVAIKTGVKTLAINYDAKVEKLAYDAMLPLLTIAVDEDWEAPFVKLKELKREELLEFANSQKFEWKYYSKLLKNET